MVFFQEYNKCTLFTIIMESIYCVRNKVLISELDSQRMSRLLVSNHYMYKTCISELASNKELDPVTNLLLELLVQCIGRATCTVYLQCSLIIIIIFLDML